MLHLNVDLEIEVLEDASLAEVGGGSDVNTF